MIQVVSVRFKNRGKAYYFDPGELQIPDGADVIVETAKGLELGTCARGCHAVEDAAVVQPLRPVVRLATAGDQRVAEINRKREREAYGICQQKIEEHGLDMHLVDAECSFEGNKTTFYFTSDGRVDFRELVKDLAGVFRNRIELRQIGVRDEAKMLGGLGICGRPFCCSQFLEDFQPVSTKMAKVQSMSLNPAKISGSCGRLMCCLRYEEQAYEDLTKTVPKLGAYVETPAGYGQVSQVNLLRRTVKVRMDGEGEEVVKAFGADDVAVVPGGRPKPGEKPPEILKYRPAPVKVPEEPEQEEPDIWAAPQMFASDPSETPAASPAPRAPQPVPAETAAGVAEVPVRKKSRSGHRGGRGRSGGERRPAPQNGAVPQSGAAPQSGAVQPRPVQPVRQDGVPGGNPAPRTGRPHHRGGRGRPRPEGGPASGPKPPKPE